MSLLSKKRTSLGLLPHRVKDTYPRAATVAPSFRDLPARLIRTDVTHGQIMPGVEQLIRMKQRWVITFLFDSVI